MRMPSIPRSVPSQALRSEGFARAWIALHGPGGEDGTMQGALEWIGVPYTGSGVLASALTMDKLKTKRVVVGAGYAAPEYAVLSSAADLAPALKRIGLPMMVKPASQGSSVGMTKVKAAAELRGRLRGGAGHRPGGVRGDASSAAMSTPCRSCRARHCPRSASCRRPSSTTIRPSISATTRSISAPAALSAKEEAELQAAALAAFKVTDCSGWGRVDFMRDRASNKFYFIEINTTPGMTSHSLVPMAARQAGIDFEELVWRVLETSFSRTRK